MAHSDASQPPSSGSEPTPVITQPVVIRQGGHGVALVVAALIVAGAVIYAVNQVTQQRQEKAPMPLTSEQVQQGLERVKGLAEKALQQPN